MEKKKKKLIDNWATTNDRDDVRFTYEDLKDIESCPTCHADLPPNHPLRNETHED